MDLKKQLKAFAVGATEKNILVMVLIFVLAGAFASGAKAMGAVDAMVNLTIALLPPKMILAGLFLASLVVSFGIGTSVGTIVAIVPFAAPLAAMTPYPLGLIVATVVGGAFFGDNLSFISDTTIAATQSQQIPMREKFAANFKMALPAALITLLIYVAIGLSSQPASVNAGLVKFWHILPYAFVMLAALCGMNVLVVLFIANILIGVIGINTGAFTYAAWIVSMGQGIAGMLVLITISLAVGGVLGVLKYNGVIDWIIRKMKQHIHSRRTAAFSIAGLVALVDVFTANNTIAILSVGHISRDIADTYGLTRRQSASILDIFSCIAQSFLPYGAQLLMASGIAGCEPWVIIPYLFYPMVLLLVVVAVISLDRKNCG